MQALGLVLPALLWASLAVAVAVCSMAVAVDAAPNLSGIRKVGLRIYSSLAANNISSIVMQYRDHPAVTVLNVLDKDWNVDINQLYKAAVPMFADGSKQTINIPLIGDLLVDRSDVEKLYRYIKEG